jgi:ankyrin repeat protein
MRILNSWTSKRMDSKRMDSWLRIKWLDKFVSNDDFVSLVENIIENNSQSKAEIEFKIDIMKRLFNQDYTEKYDNYHVDISDEELEVISNMKISDHNWKIYFNDKVSVLTSTVRNMIDWAIHAKKYAIRMSLEALW